MAVENQARIEVVRVVVKQPHRMGRVSLEKVAASLVRVVAASLVVREDIAVYMK